MGKILLVAFAVLPQTILKTSSWLLGCYSAMVILNNLIIHIRQILSLHLIEDRGDDRFEAITCFVTVSVMRA